MAARPDLAAIHTRTGSRRILVGGVLLLVCLLELVACESDKERGAYADMLRLVPAHPAGAAIGVLMGDLALYRELAEIELDGAYSAQEYLDRLEAPSEIPFPGVGFIVHPESPFIPEIADMTAAHLGFGLQSVDQWLFTFMGPEPEGRFAIRGSFEPDRIDDLLARCDDCPADEKLEHRSTPIYAWGGDRELGAGPPLSPPLFDNLGRGCCIAVQDRYILRAYSRDGVRAMLDAQNGQGSLADEEAFRLAAEALDRLRLLRAVVTNQTIDRAFAEQFAGAWDVDDTDPGAARRRQFSATAPDATLLLPYAVIAVGPGYQDGARFTGVVLVHESDEDARANADRFAQRVDEAIAPGPVDEPARTWGEALDRVDIEVAGRVLRARLWGETGPPPGGEIHDPLFLHE